MSAKSSVEYILDIIGEWIFFLVEFPVSQVFSRNLKKG